MANDVQAKSGKPQASRLKFSAGYEKGEGTLLTWAYIEEKLEKAQNYWLATIHPNQRPHVTPIWGAWIDGALYFDGIPTARWARNLAANPSIAIHLESGDEVVILEGEAEDVEATDAELGARIVAVWDEKYGRLHPEPATDGIFRLRPKRARAWHDFPHDAARWQFPDS